MQQVQLLKPNLQTKPAFQILLKSLVGSLFIALSAQISIPLFFTPVPLSCQTLAILLLGVTWGSRQAMACTLLYLFEAIVGLPVLAGGLAKPMAFIGPTAGYLYAMPLLAYMAGKASSKKHQIINFSILLFSSILFLFFGTCFLATLIGWTNALTCGFYPFLAGDTLKVLMITFYLTKQAHFE